MDHRDNCFTDEPENLPDWFDQFEIGEEIVVKNHIYKVHEIQKSRLILKPVKPTDAMAEKLKTLETMIAGKIKSLEDLALKPDREAQ